MTKWLRESLEDAARRTAALPPWAIALDYAIEHGTAVGAWEFAVERELALIVLGFPLKALPFLQPTRD